MDDLLSHGLIRLLQGSFFPFERCYSMCVCTRVCVCERETERDGSTNALQRYSEVPQGLAAGVSFMLGISSQYGLAAR